MTSHAARRAAAAVSRQAPRKTAADPKARGADWRTATVASISTTGPTAGTITTTDGIPCRRMQNYQGPLVGDQVVISRSGNGNWLALGRLASADGWITLGLASGWSAWGTPYWTPSFRINGDGTASMSGLVKAPASAAAPITVATLPFTPAGKSRFAVEVASGVFGVLDINITGVVQLGDYTGNASWASLDVARFRII